MNSKFHKRRRSRKHNRSNEQQALHIKALREKGRLQLQEGIKKRLLKESAQAKIREAEAARRKEAMGFYGTDAWRELRYRVIVKYGKTCACCGASAKIVHVDHIKPRSKYPELELEFTNLQILCEDCNMGKGAWDETDWREKKYPS